MTFPTMCDSDRHSSFTIRVESRSFTRTTSLFSSNAAGDPYNSPTTNTRDSNAVDLTRDLDGLGNFANHISPTNATHRAAEEKKQEANGNSANAAEEEKQEANGNAANAAEEEKQEANEYAANAEEEEKQDDVVPEADLLQEEALNILLKDVPCIEEAADIFTTPSEKQAHFTAARKTLMDSKGPLCGMVLKSTEKNANAKRQKRNLEEATRKLNQATQKANSYRCKRKMQNALLRLLLAAFLVAASSSLSSAIPHNERSRRHLREETTCTLFQKATLYGPTRDNPNEVHRQSWACAFSNQDAKRLRTKFVEIEESPNIARSFDNALTGQSLLTVSEAIVGIDSKSGSSRMYIPNVAKVDVRTTSTDRTLNMRNDEAEASTLKTIVIRLKDKNGKAPSQSVDEMYNDVFGDKVCLKTQMEACSYGKVKIEPFIGTTPSNMNVTNGVVEVTMDHDANHGQDENEAWNAAIDLIGDLEDPMFGLVMFAYPPDGEQYAYAYINAKYSYYSNGWLKPVSVQMHEVGHNFGLGHSGQGNDEYGDNTGVMGYGRGRDDEYICYNPQKNYQLGWYSDKTKSINPLDGKGNGSRDFILNGVADYDNGNNDALISLRLEQTSKEQDYYIGFNRAKGIHLSTNESKNMVTIVRKDSGNPMEYGKSTKIAALRKGQNHVIKNFNGDGMDVTVEFMSVENYEDVKIRVIAKQTMPTQPPTLPPGCDKVVTVEFMTDRYPNDNTWKVTSAEGFVATSPTFEEQHKLYTQQICLPESSRPYKFTVIDNAGDGNCCDYGDGYYRVRDNCGKIVVDSTGIYDDFERKKYDIKVKNKCHEKPQSCKNEIKKNFRLNRRGTAKKRSCAFWAKKGNCGKKVRTSDGGHKGKFVWELCKDSCKQCDA